MNSLEIVVRGKAKSGKSKTARVIAEHLHKLSGKCVEIQDDSYQCLLGCKADKPEANAHVVVKTKMVRK